MPYQVTFPVCRCLTAVLIGVLALTMVLASPVLAQSGPTDRTLVVVRVKGAGFRVGDILRAGQSLSLARGEELDLLSSRGRRMTYKGPYSGPVDSRGQPEDRTRLQLIRDAIFGLDEGTQVLGGTRRAPRPRLPDTAGETPDAAPTPSGPEGPSILIDLSAEDTWCAVDDLPVWLIRPNFGRARATLTIADGTQSAPLTWSFFSDAARWPDAVSQKDGERYTVAFESGESVSFSLRKVTSTEEPAQDLVRLAENGCRTQVERAVTASAR